MAFLPVTFKSRPRYRTMTGLLWTQTKVLRVWEFYKQLSRLTTCSYFTNFHGAESDSEPKLRSRETKLPVLIVGAGPVGLSLSILLSKYGLRSVVVEKRSGLSRHPQAHFINNRTMEIFRKMEGLADEIEKAQPPLEHWRRFVYCNTLAGPVIGTVDHLQPQDISREKSPTYIAHFSQHRLLPLLLNRAEILSHALSIKQSTAPEKLESSAVEGVHFGYELVSFDVESGGVVARFSSFDKNSALPRELECSYMVATDGAGSSVRRLLNVGMEGEEAMQKLITVHFTSKELGQFLMKSHPGMLYFVFNASVIAVIVAHDLQEGEFIAQIPFYPPQQRFEDFTPTVCRNLIREVAGIETLEVEVITTKQWVMHAQVAERFSDFDGRVFLAGDSAHRFPPAGGFGMNTGIQDVHNLAWKLAAVNSGWVPREFLSTYYTERYPIAKANTALSVANFEAAMAIPTALGLSPLAARITQKIVEAGASWLPKRFQGAILDGVFAIGRLQVSDVFLNEYNPIASSRISRVQQILQEGSSLQLQFPAEDLGFRYNSGALVPEDSEAIEVKRSEPMGRRREYIPSSKAGARLPHLRIRCLDAALNFSTKLASGGPFWGLWYGFEKTVEADRLLETNPADIPQAICSTLDLISSESVELLLIVGPGRSGFTWGHAALEVGKAFDIPLKITVMWPSGFAQRCNMDRLGEEERYVINSWSHLNTAPVVHVEEVSVCWWNLCELSSSGALLVRPDGHIAWRTAKEASSDASVEVERVFRHVLRTRHYPHESPGVYQSGIEGDSLV